MTSGWIQFSANKYFEEIGKTGIGTDTMFCEDNVKKRTNFQENNKFYLQHFFQIIDMYHSHTRTVSR